MDLVDTSAGASFTSSYFFFFCFKFSPEDFFFQYQGNGNFKKLPLAHLRLIACFSTDMISQPGEFS